MSQVKPSQRGRRRKVDDGALNDELEVLSKKLCPPRERAIQRNLQHYLHRRGNRRIALFPVWRKYRWKALQVAKLQRAMPILKKFPLKVTTFLCELVYQ